MTYKFSELVNLCSLAHEHKFSTLMNISGKSNEHRFMKARHDRVPVLHHDSNFKFTPKVFSITPNRNLNTPKVFFVTLGILFRLTFRISLFSVDDDVKSKNSRLLSIYSHAGNKMFPAWE